MSFVWRPTRKACVLACRRQDLQILARRVYGGDLGAGVVRLSLEAWEEAVYDGLDPDCIATAAIFAALSDMIASYGEEPVAVMCERLPERIRNGEFTVMKTRQ